MNDSIPYADMISKLHSETALISWHELQRFFAQGKVLRLDSELDLVETAVAFAQDDTDTLAPLIENGLVAAPDNNQARKWFKQESQLWSVVVAPYVLVQEPH